MVAPALDLLTAVLPAQAGTQLDCSGIVRWAVGSRLRGNDTVGAEK